MKINIDAGHGSNTAGKRTPPMPKDISFNNDGNIDVKKGQAIREHTANVGVAVFLDQELQRCGFETFRTGWNDANPYDDPDTSLSARQSAIAKANCDYSVSIHFNAHGDGIVFTPAEGVEVLIHTQYVGQSEKLAQIVLKHLVGGAKQRDRGVKRQSLAMCNCNDMNVKGAILVELAFMTNLREATELMGSTKFWKESAQEIAKGLCEFIGVKYIQESKMPTKSITPDSPKEDIIWAQERLNIALPAWVPKLKVDGIYGPKMRIAVLVLWDKLEWGAHMNNDGRIIGKASREYLANVI